MRAARKTEDIYRDACRRSHRILASYLAFWAWKKGVDCLVLDRHRLFPFLGLKKAMRDRRLRWLDDDIRDFFPHQESVGYSRSGAHMSLYLSRRTFPDDAFVRSMTDAERVRLLSDHGVRASVVPRLPGEDEMIATLATAATGGGGSKSRRRKPALAGPSVLMKATTGLEA